MPMKLAARMLVACGLMAALLPLGASAQTQSQADILATLPAPWQAQFQTDLLQIQNSQTSGDQQQLSNALQIYQAHFSSAVSQTEANLQNYQAQSNSVGAAGQQQILSQLLAFNASVMNLGNGEGDAPSAGVEPAGGPEQVAPDQGVPINPGEDAPNPDVAAD
jgi:hypothetical protein